MNITNPTTHNSFGIRKGVESWVRKRKCGAKDCTCCQKVLILIKKYFSQEHVVSYKNAKLLWALALRKAEMASFERCWCF